MMLGVRGRSTKRKRLLIVDDEVMILRALGRTLKREYDVTALSSPEEALGRLASGESWDIVLSDVMMPEMSGVEFAKRAVGVCPDLAGRIALMTGGAASPEVRTALEQSGLPVIEKPIDFAKLRTVLATLSGQP
jgi:DNA-binding NtrC family response regulator